MSIRSRILERFSSADPGSNPSPLLLLDLTLWHKWHRERGTLPDGCGDTLIDASRALGTPAWAPFKPWRVEYEGVEVTTEQSGDRRDVVYRTGGRTLLARWTRGPDGDWWQTEYPVKTPEDVGTAAELAAARRYILDSSGLDEWRGAVGEDGIVALELPMRPYSELFHVFVGWGAGMSLLLGAGRPLMAEMLASLERALAQLTAQLAALPGDVLLAPDNLDGQYISPRTFTEFLTPSYTAAGVAARSGGKRLVVHVGGPARRLIPLLATAGVDTVEGVAGAPQSDATLAEARESAGPRITLWGGIPQDVLLPDYEDEGFEAAVGEAVNQARADAEHRSIVGVADRVPVFADAERIRRLVELMG